MINMEDLIKELGGFRRYQILQFLLLCTVYMIPSMQNFSSIFTANIPPLLCKNRLNTSFNCDDLSSSIAYNTSFLSSNTSAQTCLEWQFDKRIFQSTIATKFELICSYEKFASVVTSLYMLGFLVGSSLFGALSDSWGRLTILMVCGLQTTAFGVIAPLAQNLWLYALLRFLVGMGVSGLIGVTFTMAIENIDTHNRTLIGILLNYGWSTGIIIVSLVSYFIRDFLYVEIIIAIPALLTVLSFIALQESPRWLIVSQQNEKAYNACRAIAKFNDIPEESLKITNSLNCKVSNSVSDSNISSDNSEYATARITDLFRTPGLRKITIIVWFQFAAVSLVYYGVSLGVGNLAGSIHLNTIIGALLEYPSYAAGALMARRFGRIPLLTVCFGIAGLSCLGSAGMFQREGLELVVTTTSMIGRAFISIGFVVLVLYAGEVAPTCIRNTFVGTASTWARFGGMLAPQIGNLGRFYVPLPFLVYGSLSIISLFLCFFVPETNNRLSPDTIEEGEKFVTTKKDDASSHIIAIDTNDVDDDGHPNSPDVDADFIREL